MYEFHFAAPLSASAQACILLRVHIMCDSEAELPDTIAMYEAFSAVAAATTQDELYASIQLHTEILLTHSAILSFVITAKATMDQEFSPEVYEAAIFFKSLAGYLSNMRRAFVAGQPPGIRKGR